MRKTVAASACALLMSVGLVATAASAAHADPYPGMVATTTTVGAPAKVQRDRSAKLCATVAVKSGTGSPVGTVTISVTRIKGQFGQSASFKYSGGRVCLETKALTKTGRYAVKAGYAGKAGTVFANSADTDSFKVVKRRR